MKRTKKVKAVEWMTIGGCPIWELDRTAEAYDAMVEQMAKASAPLPREAYGLSGWEEQMGKQRAALRAIGITRTKEIKK